MNKYFKTFCIVMTKILLFFTIKINVITILWKIKYQIKSLLWAFKLSYFNFKFKKKRRHTHHALRMMIFFKLAKVSLLLYFISINLYILSPLCCIILEFLLHCMFLYLVIEAFTAFELLAIKWSQTSAKLKNVPNGFYS